MLGIPLVLFEKHCKWRKSGAVGSCSAGVAIAKYWKGCGLSITHSQPGAASWSCDFRSAGLTSAVTHDGQRHHLVYPVLVRVSVLDCRLWLLLVCIFILGCGHV